MTFQRSYLSQKLPGPAEEICGGISTLESKMQPGTAKMWFLYSSTYILNSRQKAEL